MAAAALAFSGVIPFGISQAQKRHAAWDKLAGPVLRPTSAHIAYKKHMARATFEFFTDIDARQLYAAVMPLDRKAIQQHAVMWGSKVQKNKKRIKVIRTFGFKTKKDMNAFLAYPKRMHDIMFDKFSLSIQPIAK